MKKEPIQIHKVIQGLVREIGLENEYLTGLLEVEWERIVGESISKNTQVKKFEAGVLHILCNSAIWRAELILRRDKIKDEINQSIGRTIINDIIIR